jgi:hypothetical protein
MLRRHAILLLLSWAALCIVLSCQSDRSVAELILSERQAQRLHEGAVWVEVGSTNEKEFTGICIALAGKPTLTRLSLNSTFVNSAGFESLQVNAALRHVDVLATQGFDEDCIRALAGIRSLRVLRLSVVPLSDEGIYILLYEGNLDELHIGNGVHDDEGLRPSSELFARIIVTQVHCRRIVLDVSWLIESGGSRGIVSMDDVRSVNERAGWELVVVGNTKG